MGIDEAGIGEEKVAVPGERAGWAGSVVDVASQCAGGGDVGGDAGAGNAEPVDEGSGGQAGSSDLDRGRFEVAKIGKSASEGENGRVRGAGGWPAAAEALEAVEVAGGGAKALEVDVHGLRGYEVGATGADEAKVALNQAVADGSLRVGGEVHLATEAGVAAEEEAADFAQWGVTPCAAKTDRDLFERGGATEGSFEFEEAGVGDVGVGASGMGGEAEMPLLGVGEPESEVGVGERDGGLFAVELEVEAGSGGFNVGEAGGGAGVSLGSGSGVDVGGVEEDTFEIPLAVGEVDEVDAGFGEADGGELDAAAPKGAEAEGGADGVGADDGLVAEGGVFVYNKVFKREAR